MKNVKLAEWPNRKGNVIRVLLSSYKGRLRLDIREWFFEEEKLRAGLRGVSIEPQRFRKLAKAVRRARAIVKK
jgi:hypothetical protein